MKINIEGNDISLQIRDEGEFSSQHTNKPLRWMEVSFRVFGTDLFEKTRDGSEITIISDDGEESVWKKRELSHSYTQGRPAYDVVWELSEVEILDIETLILKDFEVKPYFYLEEIRDNCLFVTALVKLTLDEFEQLKAIYFGEIYFPVIRRGINDDPKEMRFCKIIWSKDEEIIKFKIYLVDKQYDAGRGGSLGLFEPEMSNVKSMLAGNTERLAALLKLLEEKELLTSEEIDRIKTVSDKDYDSRMLEFERVRDIDKYAHDDV
jgi:hypothetical protein